MEEKQLIASKKEYGLEITRGVFVVNHVKFVRTEITRLKSKSKIVREASKVLLQAYMLKTGIDIPMCDNTNI